MPTTPTTESTTTDANANERDYKQLFCCLALTMGPAACGALTGFIGSAAAVIFTAPGSMSTAACGEVIGGSAAGCAAVGVGAYCKEYKSKALLFCPKQSTECQPLLADSVQGVQNNQPTAQS